MNIVVAMLIIYQIVILFISYGKNNQEEARYSRIHGLYFLFAISMLSCFPVVVVRDIVVNVAATFYFVVSYIFIFFKKNIYNRCINYAFCVAILLCWSKVATIAWGELFGVYSVIFLIVAMNILLFENKQDIFINSAIAPFIYFYCGEAFGLAQSFQFVNMFNIMLISLFVSNFIFDMIGYKQSICFTYRRL